jgi:hypothetical protein
MKKGVFDGQFLSGVVKKSIYRFGPLGQHITPGVWNSLSDVTFSGKSSRRLYSFIQVTQSQH